MDQFLKNIKAEGRPNCYWPTICQQEEDPNV